MGVGHALTVVSGLTALLRFGPAGAMGPALTAFEMSAMIGVLGGTAFLRLLPSWLPWNVARLIGCSPQLLTFAVLPRLLTAIPRDPETAARPIFAEKKVVTSTRTHDRRRISDQTGRKTFRAAQCRSGCRSNDRVGDDGHAPRGLAAGSVGGRRAHDRGCGWALDPRSIAALRQHR